MLEPNGSAVPLTAANGRPIKFTPERLQQIKNLVERGLSREQIAETTGVTLGSLQVTCSRLGISLRRPRPSNGLPPQQSSDEPTMPEHRAKFALQMQYRGRERIIELPLSQDRLAIEAHFHNLSVGEMAVKLITAAGRLISSRCSHEAPHCCACHVYGDRADHLDPPDHLGRARESGQRRFA